MDFNFVLKRDHDYYYQVQQQQLHTTKRYYCDFTMCAFDAQSSKLVRERILPDSTHWEAQVEKLSLFKRIRILPEILGRWYTRKRYLEIDCGTPNNDSDCYCRSKTDEKILWSVPTKIAPFLDSIHHVSTSLRSQRPGTVPSVAKFLNLIPKKAKFQKMTTKGRISFSQ